MNITQTLCWNRKCISVGAKQPECVVSVIIYTSGEKALSGKCNFYNVYDYDIYSCVI